MKCVLMFPGMNLRELIDVFVTSNLLSEIENESNTSRTSFSFKLVARPSLLMLWNSRTEEPPEFSMNLYLFTCDFRVLRKRTLPLAEVLLGSINVFLIKSHSVTLTGTFQICTTVLSEHDL